MRVTIDEAEDLIKRLSPTLFTKENSSFELQLEASENRKMMELRGYSIIGWTKASSLHWDRSLEYACMFESDDGYRIWCHFTDVAFMHTASLVKKALQNKNQAS